MTIEEALKYFKSGYEMCKKIGAHTAAFSRWKKQKFIPLRQQIKINEATGANMPIDLDKEAMEVRIGKNISN